MTGSIVNAQTALQTLLKSIVTSVPSNKIYIAGQFVAAQPPRIRIYQNTPAQQWPGLGASAASPMWRMVDFRVDVEAPIKRAELCDTIGAEIEDAIGANANYTGTSGRFYMLRVAGGTATMLNEGSQLYVRSIKVTGRWLQTG